MYHIHGINFSSNTAKTVYVAEELGIKYEYTNIDMSKQEQKTEDHLKRHPFGKVPTLTHDGKTLFESGAICRYMASVEGSDLYPTGDNYARCQIDQWMDFFSVHLGKWLNTYAFEKVARKQLDFGEPNVKAMEEAQGYIETQLPVINEHLSQGPHFANGKLSIADHFAFSYMENAELGQIPMDKYTHVNNWYSALKQRDSIKNAKKKMGLN